MKNIKSIYILIPAVLLVWGIIGYRIFSGIVPSQKKSEEIAMLTPFRPKKTMKKEVFELILDYRDPFLGALSIREKKIIKPKPRVKDSIVFPDIHYKGIFSSSNKSNTIFLIAIEGKQEMFKKHETHQQVKLLKGDKKKITIKYKTEKKTYQLQ